MPMVCHPSYPLNSDMASPPGTFAAYLSCAEMARPRTASQPVAIPIVNLLMRVIALNLLRKACTAGNQFAWSTRVAREYVVAIFRRCVAAEAGPDYCFAVRLAVGELRKPPTRRRGVL